MNLKQWQLRACLPVLAFLFASTAVQAEQSVAEKSRVVYHIAKVQMMEVGDVPGHLLGIADQRGLTTTDRGEVGIWSTKVVLDLINGAGPHESYTVTTFEDGSRMITRAKGFTTPHPDGTSTFEGTFSYVAGSGRFEGIRGEGSYSGRRLAPLAPDVPVDLYMDVESTYTLPTR